MRRQELRDVPAGINERKDFSPKDITASTGLVCHTLPQAAPFELNELMRLLQARTGGVKKLHAPL